ncbi:MAG: CSLREA domain-containing protein, partial [Chloroflexales bacterium]
MQWRSFAARNQPSRAIRLARRLLVLMLVMGLFPWATAKAGMNGVPAIFTVNSTGDESDSYIPDGLCNTVNGTCTLRAAIEQANAMPNA